MANDSLISKLMSFSPNMEMLIRRVYWANPDLLYRLSQSFRGSRTKQRGLSEKPSRKIDFNKVIQALKDWGVRPGQLIVMHSAYRPLKATGLSPQQINEELLKLLTSDGTLAMPAIPSFPNDTDLRGYLRRDISDICFDYDVVSSPVKTGALPTALMKMPGAIRSRHPVNTMVALGPLAKPMMGNNLNEDLPLACGSQSSWKFCHDKGAIVVGLGTDLTHSLTMIHVVEDMKGMDWPVQPWYRQKRFRIRDGDFKVEVTLQERHPQWGALHFGERTLCKDLLKNGILRSTIIEGILLEALRASDLVKFLDSRNSNGYPYFWVRRYLTH